MTRAELSVEYFTSHPMSEFRRAHEAALPLWESGQPVPALHRPVARLRPSPEVLTWLEDDVRALDRWYWRFDYELLLEDPPHNSEDEHPPGKPLTPRLADFLRTTKDCFGQVIRTDLGTDREVQLGGIVVIAGLYEAHPEFYKWHRDFEQPGTVSYALTMLGKPTSYSQESTSSADFDHENNLLTSRIPGRRNVKQYGAWVVSAHHGTFTGHCGPGPEANGHPRILFNYFTYDAL